VSELEGSKDKVEEIKQQMHTTLEEYADKLARNLASIEELENETTRMQDKIEELVDILKSHEFHSFKNIYSADAGRRDEDAPDKSLDSRTFSQNSHSL